jgi:hypothetical protein
MQNTVLHTGESVAFVCRQWSGGTNAEKRSGD